MDHLSQYIFLFYRQFDIDYSIFFVILFINFYQLLGL